jgi:hypothetical protein
MTENEQSRNETQNDEADSSVQDDELSLLKQRAKLMGLKFSNNIKLEKLREKVNAAQSGEKLIADNEPEEEVDGDDEAVDNTPNEQSLNPPSKEVTFAPNPLASVNPLETADPVPVPPKKKLSLREHMVQSQMKLVRLRIQNLDPKKKDLPGEVFTVANEFLGAVKKYIPYGEASDEGYHVPYCIFTELESRRFQNIRTFTDKITRQIKIETSWAREFSLEVLPPLTTEELTQLASAQAAAGNK